MEKQNSSENASEATNSQFLKQWHYRPDVPIQASPIFSWPLSISNILRWIASRWFNIAENSILVIVATISWFYFQPSLEQSRTFEFGWIAEIYLRNMILMIGVAGGLHLYFHAFKRQGNDLKHDIRELKGKGRPYTFNNQLIDNIVWTLASGVTFWTAYEVLMFWGLANGYAPMLQWADNPVWFVMLFLLTPLWISFHFYWIHRGLHWRPLFNIAHKLHHRNKNVGPWSGLSMHPIEHLMFFSSILIHFIIASHPIHILFHMQHQSLTAATSHTGFSGLLVKDKNRLALGTFHHQMHHRYLDCNYGNLEVPFDKWFGSFHNGTLQSHQALQMRRKQRI